MTGKRGNKGGNSGDKKPEQPKETKQPTEEFKFNFGGEGGKQLFDFGGKDAPVIPMIQKKLNTLIGKSSGYFESLPVPVQNRIRALKKLHSQKTEMDNHYKEELLALQSKYEKLFNPLYDRRKQLVIGAAEPTEDELKEDPKEVKEEKKVEQIKEEVKGETKGEKEEEADVKGIPNFLLEAFKHHQDFQEMISKQDEKALKYLMDVRYKSLPPESNHSKSSFILEFEFNDNPYFTNKILTKTYFLTEHEQLGETMFDKMEGCEVNWKPGNNFTVKLVQVQQPSGGKRGGKRSGRGKGKSGGTKTVTVEEPCESFFNFFKSDVASAFGVDVDDEEFEDGDLQDLYEADYEYGLAVKEQIIPSAVLWFTGEIQEPIDSDDDQDGGDEEGEYDSAEDPDFAPDPNAPEQKPDCAQQ